MKKTPVFVGSAIALTVVLYLLVYYLLPGPPPSAALVTLLAGISLGIVWAVMSLRSKGQKQKTRRPGRKTNAAMVFVAGWLAFGPGTRGNALLLQSALAPVISCVASPSSIMPGASATITANAVSPQHRALSYRYSASAGSINGNTSTATLSSAGAMPGEITVTCGVVDDQGRSASATVTVTVAPPAPPPPSPPPPAARPIGPLPGVPATQAGNTLVRVTGTAVLLAGQKEPAGYGLYSYALLSHKPSGDEGARYKAFLLELVKLPTAAGLEQYVSRGRINATFIPLKQADPKWEQDSDDEKVTFILAHYDWERSVAILSSLGQASGPGPLLVSVLQPLNPSATPHPVLLQDLSRAQPPLMEAYVQNFVTQAAKDRFWDRAAMATFALQLRNLLETAAVAVGPGRDAVKTWVKISD